MTIARKIALALLVVATSVVCLLLLIQRPILVADFERLQHEKSENNTSRCQEVILDEIERIGRDVQDWSSWDDTYYYAADHNRAYVDSNFRDSVFEVSNIDFVWVINQQGKLVGGTSRTPTGEIALKFPDVDLNSLVRQIDPKTGKSAINYSARSGIRSLSGTPAFLGIRPILDGDEALEPRGVMIMGRFVTKAMMENFVNATSTPMSIVDIDSAKSSQEFSEPLRRLESKSIFAEKPVLGTPAVGYATLTNELGEPSYVIRAETIPDILVKGTTTVNNSYQTMLIVLISSVAIGMALIYWSVSAPIRYLSNKFQTQDPDQAINIESRLTSRIDEIGILSRSFVDLGQRLSQAKMKLMRASRDAGMADVAREILHNAGNVLNTLSTSVSQVHSFTQRNHAVGISKTVQLLEENRADLGKFFEEGQKGSQVLKYLESLACAIEKDHENLRTEAQVLATTSEYLTNVVRQQTDLASSKDQEAPFGLDHLFDDLSGIMSRTLQHHDIAFETKAEKGITCIGNPGKLLQVLINLVTNAKDAIKMQPTDQRRITITAATIGSGRFKIEVQDSGCGIDVADLERIFAQDFSTKDSGMGIGLHFCYNAAKEMSGDLSVKSEGQGTGATFSLVLPCAVAGESAA